MGAGPDKEPELHIGGHPQDKPSTEDRHRMANGFYAIRFPCSAPPGLGSFGVSGHETAASEGPGQEIEGKREDIGKNPVQRVM